MTVIFSPRTTSDGLTVTFVPVSDGVMALASNEGPSSGHAAEASDGRAPRVGRRRALLHGAVA